jgi:hypothetical protein
MDEEKSGDCPQCKAGIQRVWKNAPVIQMDADYDRVRDDTAKLDYQMKRDQEYQQICAKNQKKNKK